MKNNPNRMEIILITETNFILDIAFEQSEQVERLLALIQQQNIFLAIPEYAFAEAEGNIKNTVQKSLDFRSLRDFGSLNFIRK